MSVLVSIAQFRQWAGANVPGTVSDELIQACLDESESAIAVETGQTISTIQFNIAAKSIAFGDELRRASRLLARRNSPEAIAGVGSEGIIAVPNRDPDSQSAIRQIKAILLTPEAIA